MSEKDKEKAKLGQTKQIPKDGQIVMAIMKEMGITEYDPKTIVQLNEFVYKYTTSILQEARTYANNLNKRALDVNDIKLAIDLNADSTFATPPPRDVIVECAANKNSCPLPTLKPHCGLRLPPDRYCLSSSNYTLKIGAKKTTAKTVNKPSPAFKMATKNVNFIRKQNPGVALQNVSVPMPTMKINSNPVPTIVKPKIQIMQNVQVAPPPGPNLMDGGFKRKREDESDING